MTESNGAKNFFTHVKKNHVDSGNILFLSLPLSHRSLFLFALLDQQPWGFLLLSWVCDALRMHFWNISETYISKNDVWHFHSQDCGVLDFRGDLRLSLFLYSEACVPVNESRAIGFFWLTPRPSFSHNPIEMYQQFPCGEFNWLVSSANQDFCNCSTHFFFFFF